MQLKIILLLFIFSFNNALGQIEITGRILEISNNDELGIPGALVALERSNQVATTDSAGQFSLKIIDGFPCNLIVSFPGFKTDTVEIKSASPIEIILKKMINLKEVEIKANRGAIVVSTINPLNAEKITQHEMLKAACCNLSEAFESNPSINVDYKDAVTGIKEIQLLGLGGIYVQMLNENIPDMHGLAGIYGLTFIPGPWIESIQLTKGAGSVVNGYESATGQINVELKKPMNEETPRFFFNLFGEESGAVEANTHFKKQFNDKLSSILMVSGRRMKNEIDRNSDGFMDVPDNSSINILNRWQFHNSKKLEGQLALKYLYDDIHGGQTKGASNYPLYKTAVNTRRAEVSGKIGIVYPENHSKSIGNIYQFTVHDMKSSFGLKKYNAKESSIYLQSIYQNVLGGLNHEYKIGVSYRYNRLEEEYPGRPASTVQNVPGAFLEYTYKYLDKLTIISGIREDLQSGNKWVFTPRLHGKYNFAEDFIFRFSAGRSYRIPYLLADHLSVLSSSRDIVFKEEIRPERAWNYGVNITKRGNVADKEFTLAADLYRTEFSDQLVVDSYSDSASIQFYNLKGKSYSNSLQLTFNIEIIERLNVRLAYKIDDVQTSFNGNQQQQPLISKNRALASLSYSTADEKWKLDYTVVWEGKKKLQNTYVNLETGKMEYSPSFAVMNIQVTKVFNKIEFYIGSENLLDYRQLHPIIHPDDPFGNAFDATNIWGPIQGIRIYAGLRLSIK